jgi:hypothetical protein
MNNEALKQLGIGQVATMFGIAAVAGQFAEALVGKEVLSDEDRTRPRAAGHGLQA